jgi:hypothetical protein
VRSAFGTASILEIGWLMIGLFAAYYTLRNLAESLDDKEAITSDEAKARFGAREIVAIETWINGTILDEVLRLTKALAIIIAGVAAALIPPSNSGNPVTPTAIVLTGMIFYIGCAVALGSYLAAARRRRIVLVRRERAEPGDHPNRRRTDPPMPMDEIGHGKS